MYYLKFITSKNAKSFFYSFLLILILSPALAQDSIERVDIWNQRNTVKKSAYNENGQLYSTNLSYSENGKSFEIFHDAGNLDLENKKDGVFEKLGKGGKYAVMPHFYISRISKPIETSKGVCLSIDISAEYPEKSKVSIFIQNSGIDRSVQPGHINFIRLFGFMMEDVIYGKSIVVKSAGGRVINNNQPLNAKIFYESVADAERARKLIRNSEGIQFALLLNYRELEGSCDFTITSRDVLNSRAWREFDSPVKGDLITIDQAVELSNKLSAEIYPHFQCKGNCDGLKSFAKDIFNVLFSRAKQVSFLELEAQGYLIDLDGARYKPNEIKRLAIKSSSENLNDRYSKRGDENKSLNESRYRKKVDGEAKGDILFGLVKGGGSGNYEKEKSKKEEYFEKHTRENSSKIFNKEMYDYEIEGNIVMPKGVIAKEVIYSNSEININIYGSFSKYIQDYKGNTLQLKYEN